MTDVKLAIENWEATHAPWAGDRLYESLRETLTALERVVQWEAYAVEYADVALEREHDADYAHARSLLSLLDEA